MNETNTIKIEKIHDRANHLDNRSICESYDERNQFKVTFYANYVKIILLKVKIRLAFKRFEHDSKFVSCKEFIRQGRQRGLRKNPLLGKLFAKVKPRREIARPIV